MGASGVTVATVPLRHEAELVKAHLEAAGLSAWLVDDGIIAANPLLANAVGWIKVQVPAHDEERALAVLEDLPQEPGDGGCLSCGAKMAEEDARCGACGWTYLDR
jgi:hypothetical protein